MGEPTAGAEVLSIDSLKQEGIRRKPRGGGINRLQAGDREEEGFIARLHT